MTSNCTYTIDDIPGPGPSIPFLGTGWIYMPVIGYYNLSNLHEANRDKFYRYGKLCREEIRWKVPYVHVYDPDDINHVLTDKDTYPIRPVNEAAVVFRKRHKDKYFTMGLVNTNGKEWHRLRKLVGPLILNPRLVQRYTCVQSDICNDFIKLLRQMRSESDDRVKNIMDPLRRVALESAAMFCLDTRLGCLNNEPEEDASVMIESTLELFQSYQELFYGLPLWKLYSTSAYSTMERSELTIYNIVSKYIKRAIESVSPNNNEENPNIIQSLASAKDEDYKYMHVAVADFITAGIDTSANSVAFTLYHLACNSKVQEKAYNEIKSVIGDDEDITAESLRSMPYLKACIEEAFRLTPTAPNIVRITGKDMVLSGYHIPKGTTVCCETMVSSRLPEYVDNPDEFLPERWLNPSTKVGSVKPFGYGMRSCPGREFARQELYLTTIKVLQHFRLECDEELQLLYWFIVTPKSPLSLRLIER